MKKVIFYIWIADLTGNHSVFNIMPFSISMEIMKLHTMPWYPIEKKGQKM